MTKQLKKLNQCLLQRRQNGYSIAEILLVFGIVADVLIGVWVMYTKSNAQSAIAEIQMIKKAAHEYKYAPGTQNKYTSADMTALKPYLGQSGVVNGQNIFGTAMIGSGASISVKHPCELLAVSRSNYYRSLRPRSVTGRTLRDATAGIYEQHPFYGKWRVQVELSKQGLEAGVRRIRNRMREMRLEPIRPKPRNERIEPGS